MRPVGPRVRSPGAIAVDTAGLHHQPKEMPNGNFLIFTASSREIDGYYTDQYDLEAPRRRAVVVGDGVAEMDRTSGELLWRWSAFDRLDPMRIGYGRNGRLLVPARLRRRAGLDPRQRHRL